MSNQYYTLLTNTGRQLVAQATISQKLNITHIALGDGNGAVPTPSPTRSQLVKEKARFAVNSVQINRNNTNWIEAEIIVPSSSGGYTIREIGVFAGTTLIAIGSFPATYKPLANEGGAREMAIKVVFSVENAQVVSVSLNQSLIYATQQWVEQNFVNHSEVVNSLNSTDTTKPLSAAQGKALNESKSDKNHRHNWSEIDGKPSTYSPSTHRHNWSEIDGKPSTYSPSTHRHNWNEIDGKPSTYPPSTHAHDWNSITGKPATFEPSTHTHNDKANLSGDNFTGKITAPYLELGALGNIPYPSISFNSNRAGSRYWSAEPNLREFYILSRTANGVTNGQVGYKFIDKASGIYTVATTEDNVASATKLATARTINGVAFDGTQNITIYDNTKAPTQHKHSTADLTDFTVQTLLNTANLNDIRAVGIYGQNANALATAERNYPEQWAGYLIVAPSAGGVQQEYTTYYHNNKYVRSFLEGRWREWKRIDGADWATLRDKPSTFPASAHRHNWSEIDGKPSTYPPSTHRHNWSEIDGKPSTYPPSTHTHNDKANLSGDNFTGKITAPYLELGALGNIPYPSISFNSNRAGSRYWSAEPNLREFYILSRTANGVTNGQVGYKFIDKASGIYTVATTEDNVASATKLQTPRTINGVAFDGTQNIVVSDSTKLGKTENAVSASKLANARNITLTGAVTGSVSFDGSQNVSINARQTIQRVQKSMQIPTTNNFNSTPNITVTGSVETFVDGRVVQHFTLVCSIFHFYRANAAQFYKNSGFSVNYFGEGGASFLELPLWTAMPNKVQRATINIASVENNYIHEALEWVWNWESLWNTSKNIRDKCYFGFRRISGERDEKVQIHITVEGY